MIRIRLISAFMAVVAALTMTVSAPTAQAAPVVETVPPLPKPFINVMPLGDSITWGLGSTYPTYLDGYRKDLWLRLRNVGMNVNFVGSQRHGTMGDNNHEGHSGWYISQISANVDRWMALYKPQIVLLHIGTNDVGHNVDLANAPARLSALIDKIRAARPTAHIFVATITQFRGAAERARQKPYNDAIPGIVGSKNPDYVHLVPQHLVGTESQDFYDRVHPSNCGYAKMSFVWYCYLERTLSSGWWPTGYHPFTQNGVCRY